ncbi:MAG TPA: hypothetical protein VIT65_10075 [Microlunatus sp.]
MTAQYSQRLRQVDGAHSAVVVDVMSLDVHELGTVGKRSAIE